MNRDYYDIEVGDLVAVSSTGFRRARKVVSLHDKHAMIERHRPSPKDAVKGPAKIYYSQIIWNFNSEEREEFYNNIDTFEFLIKQMVLEN